MPPCFSTLSRARAFSWSKFQPAFATPMTGTSSRPCCTIACNDGKIFLYARSPVAPKKTSASERGASIIVSLRLRRLLEVPTELEAHGGQKLVLEVGFAPRTESVVQPG